MPLDDQTAQRLEGLMTTLLVEVQKRETNAFGIREAEVSALLELPGQVRELTAISTEARDTAAQTKRILVGNGAVGLVAEVDALKKISDARKKLPTDVDRLKQDSERSRWFARLLAGGTVGSIIAITAKWLVG